MVHVFTRAGMVKGRTIPPNPHLNREAGSAIAS